MPMRKLRTCDFCGGDAAGVYEVLPPELSPTEAEQRRVVLCADCLETLEVVVDPLLDRLGIDRDADADPTVESTASGDETSEPASSATSDSGSTSATDDTTTPADTSAAPDTPTDASPSDESDTSGDSGAPSEPGTPSAFGPPEGYTDVAESDEIDLGVESEDPQPDPEHNGAADASPGSDSPGRRGGRDGADSASGPGGPTSTSGGGAVGDEPEEFRTVMRLLGNREFPIRREEVVELAASAYHLEETHVERIIDHAIDRDVLADDAGTLTRS